MSNECCYLLRSATVSYTHLDVYKRQLIVRPAGAAAPHDLRALYPHAVCQPRLCPKAEYLDRAALQAELDAVRERDFAFPGTAQLRQMQAQLQALYGRYSDEAGRLQYLQTQGVCPTCLRRIDAAGFPEIQAAFTDRLQKIQADGTSLRQQAQALAVQEVQGRQQFEAWKTGETARLGQALAAAQAEDAAQQRDSIKAKIKALSAQRVFGGLSAEEAQQYQTLYHEQGKLESEMEQIQKLLDSLPRGQKEALDKLDDEIRAVNDKITAAKACQSERAALLFAPVQMHRAGLKLYAVSYTHLSARSAWWAAPASSTG